MEGGNLKLRLNKGAMSPLFLGNKKKRDCRLAVKGHTWKLVQILLFKPRNGV